jgi:hypothetical protein
MYQRVVVAAPIRRKRPEMLDLAEYPSLSAIRLKKPLQIKGLLVEWRAKPTFRPSTALR